MAGNKIGQALDRIVRAGDLPFDLGEEARSVAAILANPDRLLSRPDVEEIFGISVRFLELAALEGGGPPMVKVGRRVFYRVEALRTWIAARSVRSTSERPGGSDDRAA